MPIATIDPRTNDVVRTFDALSVADIDVRIARSAKAFQRHRHTSFEERARKLLRAAEILESEQKALGRVITLEMGKPLTAAVAEVAKCASVCRYYAENGEAFLSDEEVPTSASRSFIRYQPIGPVLAVMPWNFPFWQVFRFAAPALMAGNVGLLKHASNVPQSALGIEDVLRRAGFDGDEFQVLLISSSQVERVLADERVKAATLTGSEPAGGQVAACAGSHIKKTVLELGGSDPFVVTPSADLEAAVETAVKARMVNNGQSCIAAKRFIVLERIADEFTSRFVQRIEKLKVGDPMDESVDIGPLATPQIVKDLDEQVKRTVAAGAKVLTGGRRLDGKGNYYAPTVLSDIPRESPAFSEELFGPVASVFRARDLDEAIALANSTNFGLGASAWANDEEERRRLIDEIDSGQVFINAMVASDPRVPFGGVKHSGYGRELGVYGIREFVNIKTIWIVDSPGRKETAAKNE